MSAKLPFKLTLLTIEEVDLNDRTKKKNKIKR